jgi:CheY-like chemotaxis protein
VSDGKRVLIVSADPRESRVLTVSLKKAGFGVESCNDAFRALELLDADGADYGALLIELEMSPMDGFELAERIRVEPRHDRMTLLALSSNKELATKLKAFELGFDELLTKPVFAKELATRIELHQQRRAMEALAEDQAEPVEGSLDELSPLEIVQTVLDSGKSGSLGFNASDGMQGEVFFADGAIVDASSGRKRGEAAFFRLMRLSAGRYSLKYVDALRRQRRVKRSTPSLLVEAIEQAEQWDEVSVRLGALDQVFQADMRRLADAAQQLPPEIEALLRLFDGVRKLAEVLDDSPLPDVEVLLVSERLVQRGLLRAPTEIEPSLEEEDDVQRRAVLDWLGGFDDWTQPRPELRGDALRAPARGREGPALNEFRRENRPAVEVPAADRTPADGPAPITDEDLSRRVRIDAAAQLTQQAVRQEQERRRLDTERQRLRDDQAAVLEALARNEAQSARAIENRARQEIEDRRRRASDAFADARPAPQRPASEPQSSMREQVVAALQLANGQRALRKQPEKQYEVISVEHVLKPSKLEKDLHDSFLDDDFDFPMRLVGPSEDVDGIDIELGTPLSTPSFSAREGLYGSSPRMPALKPVPSDSDTPRAPLAPARDEAFESERDATPPQRSSGGADAREITDTFEVPSPSAIGPSSTSSSAPPPSAASTPNIVPAQPASAEPASESPLRADSEPSSSSAQFQKLEGTGQTPHQQEGQAPHRQELKPSAGSISEAPQPSQPAAETAAKATPSPSAPSPSVPQPIPVKNGIDAGPKEPRGWSRRTPSSSTKVSAPEPLDSSATAESAQPSEARQSKERIEPVIKSTSSPQLDGAQRTQRNSGTFDDSFFAASDDAPAARRGPPWGIIFAIAFFVGLIVSIIFLFNNAKSDKEPEKAPPGIAAVAPEKNETPAPDPAPADVEPVPLDDPRNSPTGMAAQFMADLIHERATEFAQNFDELAFPEDELPDVDPPTQSNPSSGTPVVDPTPPVEEKPKPPVEEKPKPPVEEKPKPPVEEKPVVSIEKQGDSVDSLVKEGKALLSKGKASEAVAKLEAAVAKNGGHVEANYQLGLAYIKSGDSARALKHLEKVRDAKGGSASYWEELGTLYIRLRKESQGLEAYKKAIELLGPDNDRAKKLQKYVDSKS